MTAPPDAPHVATDKLLQAGVGSANVMLVVVLYLVSQVYALTGQVAELVRRDLDNQARIVAHEQRLNQLERLSAQRSPQ